MEAEVLDSVSDPLAVAEAEFNSARQALRAGREWLACVEREPRSTADIVDRRLLAAKLAVADLLEQERLAWTAVQAAMESSDG